MSKSRVVHGRMRRYSAYGRTVSMFSLRISPSIVKCGPAFTARGHVDAEQPQRRVLVVGVVEEAGVGGAVARRHVAADRHAAVRQRNRLGRQRLGGPGPGGAHQEQRREPRDPCRSCLWRKYSDEANLQRAWQQTGQRGVRVGRQPRNRLEAVAGAVPAARDLHARSAVQARQRRPIVGAGRAEGIERLERLDRAAVDRLKRVGPTCTPRSARRAGAAA